MLIKDTNHFHKFTGATRGYLEWLPNYLMRKSNNGYSKAYNCSQGQYKWFNTLQAREFGSNSNLFYSRDNIPK